MKRTWQIGALTLGWLAGLWLSTQFLTQLHALVLPLVIAGVGAVLYLFKSRLALIVLFALAVVGGLVRGQLYFAEQNSLLQPQDLIGEKVVLSGEVSVAPRWNTERLYEFYIDDVRRDGEPIDGLVKIKTLSGSVAEGQRVVVSGKLGRALGRAQAQIWYADVEIVNFAPPLPIRVKQLMERGLGRALPAAAAAFSQGLLFGGQRGLSEEVQAATKAAGLTHIVAVSGYNLTIVLLLVAAFWRRRTLISVLAALSLVLFFVFMTGASASVVRAAIMTGVILLVGTTRRKLDVRVALGATVLAMTAWSPAYLFSDLSWQLSVLALVGVLFLAPIFMPKEPRKHKLLWEIFAVSLAAHLAAAPLIAHVFGGFSLIAPLANLIILPLIPLAMLASFLAASIGIFVPAQLLWLALPSRWLVELILQLIVTFGTMPQAQLNVRLDTAAMIAGYVGLAMIIALGLRRASKTRLQQV
jgi:competence protein ComEC